ncbi:hypothetical protein BIZ37_01530 [Photobacterium sp. BZF1]|uniref:hypothetical protein n=1 Tax=Photobacterium TaxID=657 RepID=UPI001653EDC6|nr:MULTISPECIES: hypothetical protein [Photobacterium]MBC7001223.1 hypothetical protein [Photobacterium sp. BZF1]MBY5949222.1 hypothetical protein [Photobacterium rosenbergii]
MRTLTYQLRFKLTGKLRCGLSAPDKTQREQEEQASRNGFEALAGNSNVDS